MTAQKPNSRMGPALVVGFLGTVGALIGWFTTHLPMVGASETVATQGLRGAWLLALFAGLCWVRRTGVRAGFTAGLVSGLVGAALLAGAKTSGASLIELLVVGGGILLVGMVLGTAAGFIAYWFGLGTATPDLLHRERFGEANLARFALVAACAVAPLIFVGGLVTSTDSGMAVPDWPRTFGKNMLAFSLDKQPSDVFLEHSHRLFGMLVGFASLTLLVWALLRVRGWPLTVAVAAFALVCVQGALGGVRVTNNSRALAMVHGVIAQGVFAVMIALAAYLSPSFAAAGGPTGSEPTAVRRAKVFATALLHTLILQLIFGAMTRHFRSGGNHAMWTHAGFSIVVLVLATMAGAASASLSGTGGGVQALRRCGRVLGPLAGLQFLLGWGAFLIRGKEIKAGGTLEALVRTAHQANGAVLLGVAACAFVWARWAWRRSAVDAGLPSNRAMGASRPAGQIA